MRKIILISLLAVTALTIAVMSFGLTGPASLSNEAKNVAKDAIAPNENTAEKDAAESDENTAEKDAAESDENTAEKDAAESDENTAEKDAAETNAKTTSDGKPLNEMTGNAKNQDLAASIASGAAIQGLQDKSSIKDSDQKKIIVIDPGHQAKGNSSKEPVGPNATQTKAKVTGGTHGKTSGLNEYELNLQVSLKLQKELQKRGYTVIMTRTANDVDISNSERAIIANNVKADAFIRIHANGSEDTNVQGVMTICQTPNNPYNASNYKASKLLSTKILDNVVASTGATRQYVWETDSMTGINWSQVTSTIVEMGYMTNPKEDALMATNEYQYKIVAGISNGVDDFFNNN